MEQAIQEVQLNPPIYVFEFDVYLKHIFHAPHLFHACTLRRHIYETDKTIARQRRAMLQASTLIALIDQK